MALYEIVVRPLEDIRADNEVAKREGRSLMSVPILQMVEVDEVLPLMEKMTRTLFGERLLFKPRRN